MMYLDTHVIVWLYTGLDNKLSQKGKRAIEENGLLISAMVLLELQFLYETKKITRTSDKILYALKQAIGLQVCQLSLDEIVERATLMTWTRDPFGRLIVANAMVEGRPLLTKDKLIHRHYKHALW